MRYECRAEDHLAADWKTPDENWTCPQCDRTYTPEQTVAWPSEDPAHSWHNAPLQGSQADYIRYWVERGYADPPLFGI